MYEEEEVEQNNNKRMTKTGEKICLGFFFQLYTKENKKNESDRLTDR